MYVYEVKQNRKSSCNENSNNVHDTQKNRNFLPVTPPKYVLAAAQIIPNNENTAAAALFGCGLQLFIVLCVIRKLEQLSCPLGISD